MADASRLLLLACVALLPAARAAAPPTVRPSDFYGLTRVHDLHLSVSAADWQTMQPRQGGLGQPAKKPDDGRMVRSQFGFDFEYVPATLTLDGQTLERVGVRFKGNSSYAVTNRALKRPLKIDLDRYVPDQHYRSLRKLALNNGVMDVSLTREALAYQLYREAGVPAPRTAYALLTLSVPGKYDREVVGVYTLVEVIDKPFLQDRFGSKKGMLLKPERVGPLDHLGDKWAPYEDKYRPKVTPSKKAQERFIAFTKLVQEPDARRFMAQVGTYLEVDTLLRYLAATALMSSLDSFMGLPHNYYIYHDPRTDRFSILPWDLDHAFGGLTLFSSADELIHLSVKQPWLGRNPLIEKLLKDEVTFNRYRSLVESLLRTSFTAERVKADSEAIRRAIAAGRAKEKEAMAKRGDGWSLLPHWLIFGGGVGSPEAFAPKRVAAVRAQLDGTAKGVVLTDRFRRPAAPPLPIEPLLAALDADKDGHVSLDEARAGVRALVLASKPDVKGEVELRALTAALEKAWPGAKPGGLFGPPSPAARLAREVFRDAGKDGKLSEPMLVAHVEKAFGKDARLDAKGLEAAMRRMMPAPNGPRAEGRP